jgi:hypothetical protein
MSRETGTLPFRLTGPNRQRWRTATVLVMAFVMVGMAAGFGVVAARILQSSLAASLFAAAGATLGGGVALFILVKVASEVWTDFRVAPTAVELSNATLQPGLEIELVVEQPGPLQCKSWRVALVAREHTMQWVTVPDQFPQSTLEQPFWTSRVVAVVAITGPRSLVVPRGNVWRERWTVWIPDNAVVSSSSRGQLVNWAVEVTGDVNGWPKFSRSFPVALTFD